ncbi:Protein kinase domain [Trypanosoma rangeli]|uniref:Protein kinase domain n=1 Tax=Trypanosoma rangeli TaxID=5698 RepID=A0A422N4Q8_TRYRA|nr:Protein kinase domain [Trypanosoma rangeli]RNF00444.1 Protein kinase domain [Trypanosoma rangeli]|eukprot:RNF00444.1 Protein kinase domain [Trypanosoma rangeli]
MENSAGSNASGSSNQPAGNTKEDGGQLGQAGFQRCCTESRQGFATSASSGVLPGAGGVQRLTPSPAALICGESDGNRIPCNTVYPNFTAASTVRETKDGKRLLADDAVSFTWRDSIPEGQQPPAKGERRGGKTEVWTSTSMGQLGKHMPPS